VSELSVVSERPEGVTLALGAVVVGIRRAPIQGPIVGELRAGYARLAAAHPGGLALLHAFRLSPRHPLQPGYDSNKGELAALLREIDRSIVASAQVLEFGGVRAAAMRVATQAIVVLARPRVAIETFDRLGDGIAWLVPRAAQAGVVVQAATIHALYREADDRLARMDEEHLRS
jgi:hypothetical protein